MSTSPPKPPSERQERRKATTRAKIQAAAERLFDERGYAATSIDDIAESADVAPRTIYTHFPTKSAIMLAYFDDWVDAFVAEVIRRPVDEPIVATVTNALAAMNEAGWVDRVENETSRLHPIVEHLGEGDPSIAGRVLHRWMREMARIADDAAQRGGYPAGAPEPQARAVAVFAAWISAMLAARDEGTRRAATSESTGASQGLALLALLTSGALGAGSGSPRP